MLILEKHKGPFFATFSSLSLSISMALLKTISQETPIMVIIFFRSLFVFFMVIVYLFLSKKSFSASKKLFLNFSRVFTTLIAMLCTYYAYRNLPVGMGTALGMTGPLFTISLSALFLKEKINKTVIYFVFLGYCGVLFLVRPDELVFELSIVLALLANIFASISILILKKVSNHDSTATAMFYSNSGMLIITSVIFFSMPYQCNQNDIKTIFIISIFSFSFQYFSMKALKYSTPSLLAPFEYTRLIFSFIIGYVFFNEIPSIYALIGSVIIINSIYYITKYTKVTHR